MKPSIQNPVPCNPWRPRMPLNYCGSASRALRKKLLPVLLPKSPMYGGRQNRPSKEPPRRLRKSEITKIYTDQLASLYPNLTKTQIKAALVLCNNELHQSQMLLDAKRNFIHLRNPPMIPLQIGDTQRSKTSRDASTNTENFYYTPLWCSSSSKTSGIGTAVSSCSTSTNFSHNSATPTISCASVYDFSEIDSGGDSGITSWFDYRRETVQSKGIPNKTGVLIIKCGNEYKSYIL